MSSDQRQPKILFSQDQIAWLERMFPEETNIGRHDEILFNRGQRSVLKRIKEQTRVEIRIVPIGLS